MNNNKLIAEFMGCTHPFNDIHDATLYKVEQGVFELDELEYHTSWDWLMPVVEKIEDYLSDNVGKVGYFDDGLTSNDIEVRYQAVVEFIKQYSDEQQ